MTTTKTPSLSGLVLAASPYLAGFDADFVLNKKDAQGYVNQGYRFCLRYISLGGEGSGDLSNGEATQILEGGLALMPVQHVDSPGWAPTGALGQSHGSDAANDAAGPAHERAAREREAREGVDGRCVGRLVAAVIGGALVEVAVPAQPGEDAIAHAPVPVPEIL